jgi:hypothetical protein
MWCTPKMQILMKACFVRLYYGKHEQFATKTMSKAETKKFIKKLENAYVCCKDCGIQWGVYSVGCSSTWIGICQVCDKEKPVTETRDYGYFIIGIHKLKLALQNP